MSTPYYPQYQPPAPPDLGPPSPSGTGTPPGAAPLATGSTYVPLETLAPPDATPAWYASQRSINNAAGVEAQTLLVEVTDPAAAAKSYPQIVYHKEKRDAHAVKDEKEKEKYAALGYTDEPYPAEDPNQIAAEDLEALAKLLEKAGEAVRKLRAK